MISLSRRWAGDRRLFAPEVVQTSAMDCGPAALKCLLEGFGVPVSYPRLQEACQTDVDGTSIDTLEQIALTLGLDAEQIMLPVDHLLLESAQALPAMVVVRREGMTHFLVAWRRHGPFVQIMDPAKGRRWLREDAFRAELYVHPQRVPASAWREWAGSLEFLSSLRERLESLKVPDRCGERLVEDGISDLDWRGLATLDAATRMIAELVRERGLRRGDDASQVLETIMSRVREGRDPHTLVPESYWSVAPDDTLPQDGHVMMRGAVLLRVRGVAARAGESAIPSERSVPASLARALAPEAQHRSLAEVWRLVRRDGVLTPVLLSGALVFAAAGALLEILVLQGFLEIGNVLSLREHRLVATGFLLAIAAALLLLDLAISGGTLRIGRRIEARLRAALLEKLPRLGDGYFQGRLMSDLAHRAHSLDALRSLPDLGARFARTSTQLIFTAAGLAWLDPPTAWIAVTAAVSALVIPLASQRVLAEREFRQRVHAAALSRHYLDSLLGLMAARTHGAERPLRQRHESLLVEWGRSGLQLLRGSVVIEGLQMLVATTLAAWLVLDFAGRGGRPGGTLLLVYWALSLPSLGREVASILRQLPAHGNILARVLEPLSAPEEAVARQAATAEPGAPGVAIDFDAVNVKVAGHQVLEDIDVTIRSGEHVAIVGRSGAGKSTLVGLLLGWRSPSVGRLLVDGESLDEARLTELRNDTAWIDPSVHLWNRSFFDNLRYGDSGSGLISSIGSVIETADLTEVIEKLPEGLQSPLGEGGGLTSGGEGQRVRFGRALVRQHVRLAILDEPFRGLDRQRRRDMLARAREIWGATTLVCVTHDIDDTLAFERVLVLEGGRIVEDGNPAALSRTTGSLYASLLAAERSVRSDLWSGERWRRLRLENGAVTEEPREEESSWTARQGSPGR